MRCEVCGFESKYPLCKKHYAMREQGEVIPCINCGRLHEGADKPYCYDCWKNLQEYQIEDQSLNTCYICQSRASKVYHDVYADIFSCSNSRCQNAWEISSPMSNHKNEVEKVISAIADAKYPLITWNEIHEITGLEATPLNQALKRLFQTQRIRKTEDEYLLERTEQRNYDELSRLRSQKLDDLLSRKLMTQKVEKIEEIPSEKIPKIQLLADFDLFAKYKSLIEQASENIVVICPYITENHLVTSLGKRAEQQVKVVIVSRSPGKVFPSQQQNQKRALDSLGDAGAHTFWQDNVHAKVLIVDNKYALVTSMNLHATSMMSNKEVGILTSEPQVIKDLNKFLETLQQRK